MPSDVLITPATSKIDFTDASNSTKKLSISGTTFSFNSNLNVLSTTSLSSAFKAEGVNGTLFEVTDDLSNSLMSVNTIGGLPVFEVFANNSIIAGQYNANDFVISGNKIGLGYANPVNKLSVSGSVSIGASYNVAAPSNGLIVQGNVGIGTITPSAKLTIVDNTDGGRINLVGRTSDDTAAINFRATGDASTYAYISPDTNEFRLYHNDGFMSFYPGGTEKWRITAAGVLQSNNTQTIQTSTGNLTLATAAGGGHVLLSPHGTGNVGIGTATPSGKLDISVSSTMGTYGPGTINLKLRNINASETNSGSIEFIGYSGNATSPYQWATISAEKQTAAGNQSYGGKLHLWTTSGGGNGEADSGGYRRLTIDSLGNVGIGTVTPAGKLHVYNGSSHFEATSTGAAVISSGLYALQIAPLRDRITTAGTYYGGIAFNHLLNISGGATYNVAPQAWIGTRLQDTTGSERDYLVFATKPGTGISGAGNDIPIERMCIDRDGLVGIGTISPGTKLDVVGAVTMPVIRQSTTLYAGTDIIDDNSTRTVYFNIPEGGNNPARYFKVARIKITSNYQNVSLNGYFTTTNSALHVGFERKVEFDFIAYAATNPGAPQVTYLKRGPDTTNVLVYAVANGGGAGTTYYDVYIKNGWYNDTNGELAIRVGYSSAVTVWQAGLDSGTSAPVDTLVNANSNYAFDTTGNVGIGTASPNYLTDIQSITSPLTLNLKLNKTSTTNDYSEIAFQLWNGAGSGANTFGGAGTSRPSVVLRALNENGSSAAGAFIVGTFTGGSDNSTLTEKFRITSGGNVGIGTTSPSLKLDVRGAFNIGGGSEGIRLGDVGDNAAYDNVKLYYTGYNSGNPRIYLTPRTQPGGGTVNTYFHLLSNTAGGPGANTIGLLVDGSVGIGNITPANKLAVSGSTSIGSNYNVAAPANGLIVEGSVGIGTTSATYKLDVNTANDGAIRIRNGAGNASAGLALAVGSGSPWLDITEGAEFRIKGNTYANLGTWNSGSNTKLLINSSGNVGVGIVDPTAKLDVTGSNISGYSLLLRSGDNYNQTDSVQIAFGFANQTNYRHSIRTRHNPLSVANSGGIVGNNIDFYVWKRGTDIATDLGSQFVMTMQGDGNVGIGITNPAVKLHVNSTVAGDTLVRADGTNGTLFSVVDDLSDSLMSVNNSAGLPVLEVFADDRVVAGQYGANDLVVINNKVGIGTISPASKLSIVGSSATNFKSLILRNGDGTVGSAVSIDFETSSGAIGDEAAMAARISGIRLGGGTTGGLAFSTTNNGILGERVRILNNGNVGIGAVSPTQILDVRGNIKLGADNSGNYVYYVTDIERTIIRTTRSDVTQQGLFRSDGWGNFTADKSIGIGYSLGSGFDSNIIGNGNLYVAGKVGIGTITPLNKLTVISSDTFGYYLTNLPVATFQKVSPATVLVAVDGNTDGFYAELKLGNAHSTYYPCSAYIRGVQGGGIDNYKLEFGTSVSTAAGSTTKMTILQGGNVGIGNTNPEYKLDFGALNTTASTDTIRFNSYNGPSGGGSGVGAATGGGTTIGGGIIWKSNYAGYTKRSAGIMQIAEGNFFRAGLAFYANNVTDQVTDWTEAMRISSNSYVGIGTTIPTQRLDVVGSYGAADDHSGILKIRGAATGPYTQLNFGISASAGYGWIQATQLSVSNEFNIILGPLGGSVGIGTTNPGRKLHIYGPQSAIKLSNTGSGAWSGLEWSVGNGAYTAYSGLLDDTGRYFIDVGSNGDDFTILQNGNVAIGNITPANKLAVSGSVSIGSNYNVAAPANGLIVEGSVGIGITSPQKQLDVLSANNDFVTVGARSLGVGSWCGIHFGYREDNNLYRKSAIVFERTDLTEGNAQGKVHILNGPQSGSANATLTNSRLTINEAGNVGIGTVTPTSKLHLNSTTSGAILLKADGTNGTLFSVSDDLSNSLMSVNTIGGLPVFEVFANNSIIAGQYGQNDFVISGNKVGIGTASPTAKLQISGSYPQFILNNPSAGSGVQILFQNNGAAAGFIGHQNATNKLQFSSTNASVAHMTIDSNGNVGIGTAGPVAMVHVESSNSQGDNKGLIHLKSTSGANVLKIGVDGTNNFSELRAYTPGVGDSSKLILQPYGGNVGIGQIAPASKLHVLTSGGSTTAPNVVAIFQANTATTIIAGGGTAIKFVGVSSGGNLQDYDQCMISSLGYVGNNQHGMQFWVKPNAGTALTAALTINADSTVVANSSVTASSFVGPLTGNVTGTASTATNATQLGGAAASSYIRNDTDGTAGNIFSLITVTKSLTLTTSWIDTGISGTSDLAASGAYILTMNADNHAVGGGQYNETYTGIMYWYAGGTNDAGADEIPLHKSGHAPNAVYINLRTLRNSSGTLKLQIISSAATNAVSNYIFKFRRMI